VAGRILAIDFGTRRIGVAVSDALGITAQGLETLERTRTEEDLERLRAIAEEYEVKLVLVGHPLGHSGGETEMAKRAEGFARKLARRLRCRVEMLDERLTSVEANRLLREAGVSMAKRVRAADRVAATLLLQAYLDRHALEAARHESPGAGR
jgi:putative Holliday junction resolvase